MSMEIHVLSNLALPSVEAWQDAIEADGFNLKLDESTDIATHKGFLPALLHNQQSGFECFHDDVNDLMTTYEDVDFAQDWKRVLSFRWGSLAHEGIAAFMAAAAYAKATGGVVYEPQEGIMMTPPQCREAALRWEKAEFKI